MMYSYEELKEIATKYATYCISIREKLNQKPLGFEDFFGKERAYRDLKAKKEQPEVEEVIKHLNNTCKLYAKRGFMVKGKKIRSLIRTKLNEGFSVNDFLSVIDIKVYWLKDKEMHKYFRPSTLFGNKFEDYLNECSQPIIETKENKLTDAIRFAATDNY